jgi:chromosome segregation ATPase
MPLQSPEPSGQSAPLRARVEEARIVELEAAVRAGLSSRPRRNPKSDVPYADWTETLRLVNRFADQLRTAEERVAELERACDELNERAQREIAEMTERLDNAELHARDAGERRRDAEEWLRRIHDTIHKRFGAEMMVTIARDANNRSMT